MLIFEVLAEKIHSADLKAFFYFGFRRLLMEKQDSVKGKTFFWSSTIFSGKTGLCGREDHFVGLQRLFVVSQ